MRLPNRRFPLLVSALMTGLVACGPACEKNVQEVRRPGQPRDPYAAIRGAPMGYTGSPSSGVRGTPSAFGSGRASVNAGSHNAPYSPTAQARTPGAAVNPGGGGGRYGAVGSPTAYSPTNGTTARTPGMSARTPTGNPRAIGAAAPTAVGGGSAAWSPTDRR